MKERVVKIEETEICCEWHTKFEHNKGRIHFYPWPTQIKTKTEDLSKKLIIGIITDHLK
jgi:hypothetical protein